jgi:cell shape-determining protein MreC
MFTAIVGVAMIAILISQKANTAKVIQAFSTGTSQVLGTALSPVTGQGSASQGMGVTG